MTDARGGVPASAYGDPVVDLISADPPPVIKSVTSDLLDAELAAPRAHVTRREEWLEEPWTRAGGRWVEVGD
jgi:hypothetical protein